MWNIYIYDCNSDVQVAFYTNFILPHFSQYFPNSLYNNSTDIINTFQARKLGAINFKIDFYLLYFEIIPPSQKKNYISLFFFKYGCQNSYQFSKKMLN